MNVIRVTKINDDGSVAFDGMLGPNEVRYILENGLNFIMQTGVETIEFIDPEEEEENEDPLAQFSKNNENPPSRH